MEEEELTIFDDYISFHWYETLPSCSIHCMLPKYPPEVPGVRNVLTKSCQKCDDFFQADPNYVKGTFRKKKHLVHHTKPFQEFFEKYYLVTMTRYKYHYFLRIMLSKRNVEDIRLINLLVGEMMSSRDYAERLLMKFHMEIQSEHFGQGRNLSMEGNLIKFYSADDAKIITNFYSFLSDKKTQNAATTDNHMNRLFDKMKLDQVPITTFYETTDGCAGQYRCGTALWFLSSLSHMHNTIIDRTYDAPAHGT